jgi:large subunit ribosomal protein L31e
MADDLERVYIIPLRKAKKKPRSRRASAGVKIIREYLVRHMKSEDVKLDNSLNEKIWERGIHHTPSKVKVRAIKSEGVVRASLFE